MEMEKKYTHAYGQLRRLTSTIDGQIRQLSVSKKAMARFHHAVLFKKRPKDAYACVRARVYPSRGDSRQGFKRKRVFPRIGRIAGETREPNIDGKEDRRATTSSKGWASSRDLRCTLRHVIINNSLRDLPLASQFRASGILPKFFLAVLSLSLFLYLSRLPRARHDQIHRRDGSWSKVVRPLGLPAERLTISGHA